MIILIALLFFGGLVLDVGSSIIGRNDGLYQKLDRAKFWFNYWTIFTILSGLVGLIYACLAAIAGK